MNSSMKFSAKKRQLLEKLLQEEGLATPVTTTIARRNTTQDAPLSFAQQRLWFLDQLEPGNVSYNVRAALRLSGRLDCAALERSLLELVQRHKALRTTFPMVNRQPVQMIIDSPTMPLPII